MSRELAVLALREGRYTDAVATLAEPLRRAPANTELRSLRALAHASLGHVTRMVVDLKVAAEDFDAREGLLSAPWLAPHLANPYLVLAFEADDDLDFAADALYDGEPEACLERLASLYDTTRWPSTAWFLASVAAASLDRRDESLAAAVRVTELLPGFPDGWFNLGCALERSDRTEDAVAAYRASVAADPSFQNGWYNLGMTLRSADRAAESLEALTQGAAACPEEPLLAYKLAEGLALAGRLEETQAELERAIALDPEVRRAILDNDIFPGALPEAALRRLCRD